VVSAASEGFQERPAPRAWKGRRARLASKARQDRLAKQALQGRLGAREKPGLRDLPAKQAPMAPQESFQTLRRGSTASIMRAK